MSRVALVTGAAGGIGAAIVSKLEDDGWSVHGVDVADADLTTREGNRTVVAAALERFGRLDAVVANAGFQHVAPIAEFPEDQWDALIALLLTSPFLLAKYAWEALSASGDGRYCAIASAHSLAASPFKSGYVSAKHGVLVLFVTSSSLSLINMISSLVYVVVMPYAGVAITLLFYDLRRRAGAEELVVLAPGLTAPTGSP